MLISMTPPRKWVVIYTNEAWERAVDLPRGAGQGRSFWDLFTLQAGDASRSNSMPSSASSAISGYNPGSTNGSVAADAARDAAAQFDSAISNMQNFELRVRFNPARQSGNLPAGFGMEPGRSLLLQFRCASNTVMDSHMPPIGIPNTLPSNQSAPVFYFATLSTHTSATEPGSVAAKQHRPPKKAFSLLKGEDPFSDIKLGPLLGKGAFGRVYRGGQSVCVCVCVCVCGVGVGGGGGGGGSMCAGRHSMLVLLLRIGTHKYAKRQASCSHPTQAYHSCRAPVQTCHQHVRSACESVHLATEPPILD